MYDTQLFVSQNQWAWIYFKSVRFKVVCPFIHHYLRSELDLKK